MLFSMVADASVIESDLMVEDSERVLTWLETTAGRLRRSAAALLVAGALEELAEDAAVLHDAHLLELRVHLTLDTRHEEARAAVVAALRALQSAHELEVHQWDEVRRKVDGRINKLWQTQRATYVDASQIADFRTHLRTIAASNPLGSINYQYRI